MIAHDRRRGFTLLEILVAGTIFLMILTAIVAIENSSRRLTKKLDANDDVYRAAVIASAYLQQELKNAVVINTGDSEETTRLTYKLPVLDNTGQPTTNPRGNILFQAENYKLALKADGHLVRFKGSDEDRHIANLGNRAQVTFSLGGAAPALPAYNSKVETEYQWREDALSAEIIASHDNGNTNMPATYEFELSFYLRNQYPH